MAAAKQKSLATSRALKEQARAILHANDAGGFTVPTVNGLYPAQWNWDSAFVALAFVYLDEIARGWQEIDMLLRAQWQNGMVPHIVFHIDDSGYFPNSQEWQCGERIPSSGISQPPVLATFVRRIIDRKGRADWELEKLRTIFPSLMRYHRWYHSSRNYQGLAKIIHPWESGFDNNQSYDEALYNVPLNALTPYQRQDIRHARRSQRPQDSDYDHYIALLQLFRAHKYDAQWCGTHSPFQLTDIGVNAMLLRADRDLLALAQLLQEPESLSELEGWITTLGAALEQRWDSHLALYTPWDICAAKSVVMPSINGLVPLFGLAEIPTETLDAICNLIEGWMGQVTYGLPSFDPAHPLFEPHRYCRGPAWPVWSWLVAEGLRYHGRKELAGVIRDQTLQLLANFGFHEFFNPHSGAGGGGTNFSWSAAIALFFLHESREER